MDDIGYISGMRYLPQEVRRDSQRYEIVLDYLAEGNNLRSDQKVVQSGIDQNDQCIIR
ncbi:MAG: hypothetical protein ACLS5C_08075 [Waltera sp.]